MKKKKLLLIENRTKMCGKVSNYSPNFILTIALNSITLKIYYST